MGSLPDGRPSLMPIFSSLTKGRQGDLLRRVLITGTAGFIGFHLARLLLAEGFKVHGYDGLTDYYDVNLKRRRHAMLLQHADFSATEAMLEDSERFDSIADEFRPDVIVHLAAQAGVRYSLENPHAYISANVVGTLNVMEAARRLEVQHLLMASTSSVYGANTEMPFTETEKADTQLTIYAATKKANESMGHAYAHLWNLPTTMFRFFTVYGPWGRPDLALYKFVDAIEAELGRKAIRNYMPMQPGDVPATWAEASLLHRLTGYRPQTDIRDGIRHFVAWFRDYFQK
jgi:UDP-glucuronate 4-epimerase